MTASIEMRVCMVLLRRRCRFMPRDIAHDSRAGSDIAELIKPTSDQGAVLALSPPRGPTPRQ